MHSLVLLAEDTKVDTHPVLVPIQVQPWVGPALGESVG